MKIVNIYQAKTQLSRLLREAVSGEDIVIAKNGEPMVKLVPLRKRKRSDGMGYGKKYLTAPLDWVLLDEPLEEFEPYTF